jgi:hypothetical protein
MKGETTMARLVNLTPHDVNIVRDGTVILTVPKMGVEARAAVERGSLYNLDVDGTDIPVQVTSLGAVSGLLEPENGVFLIVSRIVADARKDRFDLLFPDDLVRDSKGAVIGAKTLGRSK